MPKLPTPLSQSPSERHPAESHLIMVLTHDTVVKPDQLRAARERLLEKAVQQPMLPPLTVPQTRLTVLWSTIRAGWRSVSAPFRNYGAYERMRLPIGMMHHYNFDRYYTYKLIAVSA